MLSSQGRTELQFALGKALIDVGAYKSALAHLIDGNARKRRKTVYDEAATLGLFERIRAAFGRELMTAKSGGGNSSATPVFIVGMPRSGTTLVEQILASHPGVFGAGEIGYLEEAALALDPFPNAVIAMTGDARAEFGARYVARVKTLAPSAVRIIDKMPTNFRFAGLIHLALPNARIIHICRDPIDTCMSNFAQLFVGDAQPHSYDLGELGRYYRGYEALMDHWRQVLPRQVMLEVQYERLVADPSGEARRIVAHCGLDWVDSCLEFYATQRPVRTASLAQVRRPMYRSSVGRWNAHAVALKPLLDALGMTAFDIGRTRA